MPRLLVLSFLVLVGQASAQRPDLEVCAELDRIRQQHELPGICAALVERGEVTRIGVSGVRKLGDPKPMTIYDQMHLGSCTKAMTATLLAMEVQRGRLQWDSTLAELLPQLGDHIHPDYRPVTVRQLLTHRAGLPANSPRMNQVDRRRNETEQRVELFDHLLREPPEYPPGGEYHYSNLGYMLAGLVAETLAQRPWQQLMQRELFRPLGMRSAGFGPPGRTDGIDQPWGHHRDPASGLQATQHDNPLVLGPAGRVHASLTDWARFIALHLNHQPRRPLLSDAMIEQLHQPADGEDYALGWGVHRRAWAAGVALSHTGSNTYWFAVVWMSPRRDLAMLAATNAGGETAARACDEAVVSLLKRAARR